MLTKKQEKIYKTFEKAIRTKDTELLSSHQRAWGKTYILNELGLDLQSQGYIVYLLTEFPNANEHFATDYIKDAYDFRGRQRDKAVIIVDEYNFFKLYDICCFCREHEIPMIGFVDYSQGNTFKI